MWDIKADKWFVIVAYDIVKQRARTRVMKLLKGAGNHCQKSVFECSLTLQELENLVHRIEVEIDPETDTVRFYRLRREALSDVKIAGLGELYEPEEITVI